MPEEDESSGETQSASVSSPPPSLRMHIQASTLKTLFDSADLDPTVTLHGDALHLFNTLVSVFIHEVLMRAAESGNNLGHRKITDDDLKRILAQTLLDLCV